MKNTTAISIIAAAVLLTACKSENPVESRVTVQGKVIDGYVSGATVFLDLNYNQLLDSGEPSVVSAAGGDYSLQLTAEQETCLGYAPIVVDVPVGAVDEELGTVLSTYQMVLPPAFTETSHSGIFNVTPLTSVLWQSLTRAQNSIGSLTCETVRNDLSLANLYESTLNDVISSAVFHYNISADQLYADYVATAEQDTAAFAAEIVLALQKSVADTVSLKEAYPDAILALVTFYQSDYRDGGENMYPNAWYREQTLITGTTNSFQLDKVSDNLNSVVKTVIYGNETQNVYENGDYVIAESFEFESRNGDGSSYSCDIKERVYNSQGSTEYELVNLSSKSSAAYDDCVIDDFTTDKSGRYAFVNIEESGVRYATQYFYSADTDYPFLNGWVNLNSQAETLDFILLDSTLEGLSYGFNEAETGSANWWIKSKTYVVGEDEYYDSKNDRGEWTRRITHVDGTYIDQCSNDGVTWVGC